MAVKIVLPGAVMTVQTEADMDIRRQESRFPGPWIRWRLGNANYLVGNEETEAVLEVTLFGGTLEFTEDTITAITGAGYGTRSRWRPGGDELSASDPEGLIPDAGHDPAGMPDLSLHLPAVLMFHLVMGKQIYQSKMRIWRVWRSCTEGGDVLKLGKPKPRFDRVKKRRTKGLRRKNHRGACSPGPQQE